MIYIHPRGDPWFQEEFVMPGLAAQQVGGAGMHLLHTLHAKYITAKCDVKILGLWKDLHAASQIISLVLTENSSLTKEGQNG